MGRNRTKPFFEKIEILDTAAEGKSLAKVNDKILFVTNTVPGDIVDVQVFRKRKRFMEGRVTKFHEYSKKRITPKCAHFGTCGGCKWQFISYADQLINKQRTVVDALTRLAKIDLPEIPTIIGSANDFFYRNKLEFTFSNREWLSLEQINSGEQFENRNAVGFHVPGMFDKVLNIDKCWLQGDPSNAIRNWIYEYALKNELEFFDLREQTGFLRNLIVRTSSNGELMVILILAKEMKKERIALLDELHKQFPSISSLNYVINEKRNDTISDQEVVCYAGKDHMIEEMLDFTNSKNLQFKIGPKSFYQTNSAQAKVLYQIAGEMAGVKENELVYDLYTGTGTIANFIASQAKKVIGLEYIEEAIVDAKINAAINGLENTAFFAGDMKDLLNDAFVEKNGQPDLIITDPPRAGMHEDVLNMILKLEASRVVYVSCNPATQARDLQILDEKYKVEKVQPVDMFPQTHHVENVVLLKLKK